MMGYTRVTAGLAILVAILLPTYLYIRQIPDTPQPIQTGAATLLPERLPLAPFSLSDQQGRRYDNKRLQGHWTLLSFGYTNCPDVCPTTLASLAQLKQLLQQGGMGTPLEIGFVTIDPQRDTPERLAEYLPYFAPSFVGITGTPEAIEQLTRPLGILHRKVTTDESALDYVVDHSASLVLIDPQGRYSALFSPPHDAAIMAQDILAISQAMGD